LPFHFKEPNFAKQMRIVIMGTGTFAEPTFRALLAQPVHAVVGLVTQPSREAGTARSTTRLAGPTLAAIALEHGIEVFQPENVNTPEGVAGVRAFEPDLLVVAAYGQILSRDVLAAAVQGGINVHASLLPKYRGAAPVAWAIYHGETRTGVTIIRMSVHLDAGDILAQGVLDIGREETAGELEARLAPVGASLALEVVGQIAAGKAQGVPQDKAQITKAPKLTKEHGLIDWARPAPGVCNQVRAMQPWPTAYTFRKSASHEPERVIVNRTVPCPDAPGPAKDPGQAQTQGPTAGRLIVWAGEKTAVEILELQPAGKRRMAATEYLRGHPLQQGEFFGGM
jgi:methionyl-tRNA formyltransferase